MVWKKMNTPSERTSLLSNEPAISDTNSERTQNNEPSIDREWLRRRSSSCLPPYHEDLPDTEGPSSSSLHIWTVVPISLLGVLVANADATLVVAASQQIASDFNALSNASWLVTGFGLAQCASQPLYGKLSDIFGRKSNLTAAYALFAVGCFLCGIGTTYSHVIAGRVISGIGGAGMTALVSVIIADMVPIREVAIWRSYVNVAAMSGRALGGPVGGWLCDTIGWRWCFYGQVPITLLGLVLILWRMPTKVSKASEVEQQSLSQRAKRVDFVGAILLVSAISAFLITLDFSAKDFPLTYTLISAGIFCVTAIAFTFCEKSWVKEPILPLRLIVQRPALTAYLIAGFQLAAQFALFYSTPLYFQVTSNVSVANAGLRLVPSVVGNATAGLLSGYLVSKTGRYKVLTVAACVIAAIGYCLILIRWRGSTNWWETLYISFGGFGAGVVQSTAFVHIAASLAASDMAIAGTTLYLSQNIFLLIGIQLAMTVSQARLRASLTTALEGNQNQTKIIKTALSSVESIRKLPPAVRKVVVRSYTESLSYTHAVSIVFEVLGLAASLSIREKRL